MAPSRDDDDDDDDLDDEEEIEQVLFQGAQNGVTPDLSANRKLVQAGLIRAKELVSDALARRAEMIRLEPKGKIALAMFYIDGVGYTAGKFPLPAAMAITQMLKLLAGLNIQERSQPQSGAIHSTYTEKKYLVRVDSTPVAGGGEKLMVRIVDPTIKLEKTDEIGISDSIRKKVRAYTSEKSGLVLAAGPPLSGTSTTSIGLMRSVDAYLYSIFNLADLGGRDLAHITEFKFNEGENLEQAIARAKRQDCDVILVDPLRDAEMAKLIVEEADNTAFLSEMLARDAADAIVRLVSWVGDPQKVANRLRMVVSQKMIRKLCPDCRQAYRPNPKLLAKVGLPPETRALYRVPRPIENEEGELEDPDDCPRCDNLGYFGRMGLFEEIEMTDAIKQVIIAGGDAAAIRQAARKDGQQTFQGDGLRAVAGGKTSLEELQRVFQQKT